MKKELCPVCKEENSVMLPAESPDEPYCSECSDTIDVFELTIFIENWLEYLRDRQALLDSEKTEEGDTDAG